MSEPDGWSEPSLYGRGRTTVEPRTFTELDPVPSVAVPQWQQWTDDEWDRRESAAHDEVWSAPTYGGPRRLRPDARSVEQIRHDTRAPGPARPPASHAVPEPPAEELDAPTRLQPGRAVPPGRGEQRSTRGLLSSSRVMAVASLTSRITGFLRSALIVAALGTGLHGVGDAYNAANNFPNQVYELLLGGVLSSVLIPLLVRAQESDRDRGEAYIQRLLSIAVAALAAMTVLAVLAAPLIAGAFVDDAHQRTLTTTLAYLLLPEIFFYGLGAIFTALLNLRDSYGPGAWAPVLNNVIMIVTVVTFWALPGPATLNPQTITTAQVLVIGVGTTLGIAGQALFLVPFLRRSGFRWRWRWRGAPGEDGRLKEAGSLTGWIVAYVVISQVGVTVIQRVGVTRGVFTIFTQADLLFQMPYGILVVSLLTALMPRMSRAAARDRRSDVVEDMALGTRLSALGMLPITAGLIALGPVFTVVLFAYGKTSTADARLIGTALAASAFGLLPFAMVMLQLRVFYAMRDGRTPTLINAGMVATKVALILAGTAVFGTRAHIAETLTAATAASYLVGAVIGHRLLGRRLGDLRFAEVWRTVARVLLASGLGGAAAYGVARACTAGLGAARAGSAAGLVAGGVAGLVVLLVVLMRLRVPELARLGSALRR